MSFMMSARFSLLLCCVWLGALLVDHTAAISQISTKGAKLFDEDGEQFFVKGVVYQPHVNDDFMNDPLKDKSQCEADAKLISEMGANTIRVYHTDSSADHDACMEIFDSNGIYVWLDLTSPTSSIQRDDPEWTMKLYQQWTKKLDAFAKYDNLLFFTISNEVIDESSEDTASYVKAAVKDVKAFRNARGYRPIPLIYTGGGSDEAYVGKVAEYLTCGEEYEIVDAFGINAASWCNGDSYSKSGFNKLYESFHDLHVPVVFAETGCYPDDQKGVNKFPDVKVVLGDIFQAVFSGVVVYEWSMSENGYGVVEHEGKGEPSTLPAYNSLSSVYSAAKLSGETEASYSASVSTIQCPSIDYLWPQGDLPTIGALNFKTVEAKETYTRWTPPSKSTSGSGSDASTIPISTNTNEGGEGNGDAEQGAASENNSGSDSSSDNGMSTGAIAGIAVGVVVAVVGGLGVVVFILVRKHKAKKSAAPIESTYTEHYEKAELPSSTQEVQPSRHEIASDSQTQPPFQQAYHEAGSNAVYELGGESAPQQLPDTVQK